MRTSELTGAALDWAVAKANGGDDYEIHAGNVLYGRVTTGFIHYRPSTKWEQGGPIIDREGIDLYCNVPSSIAEKNTGWLSSWRARYSRCGYGTDMVHGPTPLIAAMRCYVTSKLGDDIEIPEELK
jgi:hypothetical protein